jgi:hypothetical protein
MTFPRAFIIAMMANLLGRGDGSLLHYVVVLAVTAPLWYFTSDPLPAAIDRGLEAFKKRYQR